MKKILVVMLLILFAKLSAAEVNMVYFYSENKECSPSFMEKLQNLTFVNIHKYKYEGNESLFKSLIKAYDAEENLPSIFVGNEWYYLGEENEEERLLKDLEEFKNFNVESPIKDGEIIYPKPVCILIVYDKENVSKLMDSLEENISYIRIDRVNINENEEIKKRVDKTPAVFIGENLYYVNNISSIIKEAKKYEKVGISFPSFYEEKKICILFFYTPGCPSCQKVKDFLYSLSKKYPLEIRKYVKTIPENAEMLNYLYKKYNITRMRAANIFIGDKFFYSVSQAKEIENEIRKWLGTGLCCPELGKENIEEEFKEWTLLTVIVGGLLDGINPCAFATLIFFIAYLERVKRKKAILPVGLAFAVGVYISYFLIGLGLLHFLDAIREIASLYLYTTIGIAAIIIGSISIIDFFIAKKGKRIILQLPSFIKKRRGRIIRRITEDKKIIVLAIISFSAGAIISAIELVCTGQVYIPTLTAVIQGTSSLKLTALLYLMVYNFMFILPLLIILSLFYYGYSAKEIGEMQKKSYAYIKLIIGIFLICIGLYMAFLIL